MDKVSLLNEENYINYVLSMNYGCETITYQSDEVRYSVLRMIDVINAFTGKNTIREEPHVINDILNGEWISIKNPNVYTLVYTRMGEPVPTPHQNNYKIEEIAIKAKKNSIVLSIDNFDSRLNKYAKMIAKKHDVLFTGSGFNGFSKSMPASKQIEDAYLNGKSIVCFDHENFNPQTIRNYASNYGRLVGKKFKVSVNKNNTTVILKEDSDIDYLYLSAKKIFDDIAEIIGKEQRDVFFKKLIGLETEKIINQQNPLQNQILPKQEPIFTGRKLYGKPVSEEEYRAAENWQRLGFASKYNWENDIKGDVDMYPNDVRIGYEEENDDEDDF